MAYLKQTIAKNIKLLREKEGLTQQDLGRAVGFGELHAQTRISQYETVARTPNSRTLEKIAKALHVDVDQFFKESSPSERPPRTPYPSEEECGKYDTPYDPERGGRYCLECMKFEG